MPESGTSARLVRARRLIDERFDQPLNLDSMAAEACFSRYHFLRQFRMFGLDRRPARRI
jgi:AraC-like DNA-binding protein